MKRTREITVIAYRRRVKRTSGNEVGRCSVCGGRDLATPRAAERLTGLGSKQLERLLGDNRLHALRADGQFFICLSSLVELIGSTTLEMLAQQGD